MGANYVRGQYRGLDTDRHAGVKSNLVDDIPLILIITQVFYPTEYNGAWGNAPDPVDFHSFENTNLYASTNAYYGGLQAGPGHWRATPRPAQRTYKGEVVGPNPNPNPNPNWTYKGEVVGTVVETNRLEHAMGSKGRSGGQYDVWQATPQGTFSVLL